MQRSRPSGLFVQAQTTIDDRDAADALVRAVVDRRLAACGQVVGPVGSVYRWRGAIETTEEWLCLFKTTAELALELVAFLEAEHPYEVPEIVVLPIETVSGAYGEWIDDETGG